MVQGDVIQMAENGAGRFSKVADVVVTNPPFGTKSNEGIDMKFLEAAQDRFHELSPGPVQATVLKVPSSVDFVFKIYGIQV